VIVEELEEVQKEFGDERRTQIIEDTGRDPLEDLVQRRDVAVTVTRGGYLKRTRWTPTGGSRAAARAASA
jgi:DNA gyrase subunit A